MSCQNGVQHFRHLGGLKRSRWRLLWGEWKHKNLYHRHIKQTLGALTVCSFYCNWKCSSFYVGKNFTLWVWQQPVHSWSYSHSWGPCNGLYACRYFYGFSLLGSSWAAAAWRPTVIWSILTASCSCDCTYLSGIHKISYAHTIDLCVKYVGGQDEGCIK
jgi:hypothetical protein